jgi:hypothetical protein
MVGGRGPFDDVVEVEAIVSAHMERPPPSLHDTVPPALWTWISAALEKNPRARPPDAATFAEGLRAVAVALDEDAPSPFSWPPPKGHR